MILGIVLIALAGVFNAGMDLSSEGKLWSAWWNKDQSWMNKWGYFDPYKGWVEKFPGSSTVFVWTTDGWHFLQFMYNNCWQLVIAILSPYNPIVSFVIVKIVYSGVFTVNYKLGKKYF